MAQTRFLVELLPADTGYDDIRLIGERCREACERLERDGTSVRLLRSVFVPQDGSCLLVYEAESARAVADAVARADIGATRVVEAIQG
jgi:flagellar biosynthesis/type III secretory pathway ATPase